jgi:hypothetical protein
VCICAQHWLSAVSEADIASGLYMFPHNATNGTFGGWFNDLDMLEVGNGPDFLCGNDSLSLHRCRAHMSLWALLHSLVIMGNDLPSLDAATLSGVWGQSLHVDVDVDVDA